MISPEEARFIRRRAYVPEHAVGMMSLISGAEPFLISGYLCFARDPWVIAVGYPLDAASGPPALEQLVAALVERFRPEQLWCIAPEIPEFIAANCVGCMDCVTECPDTAILGKVIPKAEMEAALRAVLA